MHRLSCIYYHPHLIHHWSLSDYRKADDQNLFNNILILFSVHWQGNCMVVFVSLCTKCIKYSYVSPVMLRVTPETYLTMVCSVVTDQWITLCTPAGFLMTWILATYQCPRTHTPNLWRELLLPMKKSGFLVYVYLPWKKYIAQWACFLIYYLYSSYSSPSSYYNHVRRGWL